LIMEVTNSYRYLIPTPSEITCMTLAPGLGTQCVGLTGLNITSRRSLSLM
jgi:hypothetical protein